MLEFFWPEAPHHSQRSSKKLLKAFSSGFPFLSLRNSLIFHFFRPFPAFFRQIAVIPWQWV
jgi:hypothetical protein